MKTITLLMLVFIVTTASFAKSDDKSVSVQTRLTLRSGNIELAIQQTNANASVKLFDQKGFILYQFRYNLRKGISQRFDVSQLTAGSYKINIEIRDKIITKEFTIKSVREDQIIQIKG